MKNLTLTEAIEIAKAINDRNALQTSSFRLWLGENGYYTTQTNESADDTLLYTGQGWEGGEENEVDAEWVWDNIQVPE